MLTLSLLLIAQTVIPLDPFRSIELHHGGNVIVRHGSVQRVTILQGDPRCTLVRVVGEQRLVIDNSGQECPRHARARIEVVTPEISVISVSNGGTIQTLGAFPPQAAIEAHVEQGGRIDIRSIAADNVDASVYSGGGIFTNPRKTLNATITSGGAITYWGDVRVKRSVRDGGVVQRGAPGDATKPLSEMVSDLPAIPPLPPVPVTH